MYLVDFFQRMVRKSNIPLLIYLALNVILITAFVEGGFSGSPYSFFQAFGVSIILYGISLFIALSPAGEWILRLQAGCHEIQRQETLDYIMPLFNEVYAAAKKADPSIPDDVKLFMNDEESPNAFALGRRTVCITAGMMQKPPAIIKGTLGHEFGHLAHKDTDLILVVTVGNMIVSGIILAIRLCLNIFHFVMNFIALLVGGYDNLFIVIMNSFYHLMLTLILAGAMKLWTLLGTALVMKTSRSNEYEADEFSYNLGYGNGLCAMLDDIGSVKPEGLFAALSSSHPASDDRIARLQQLGATYRSN